MSTTSRIAHALGLMRSLGLYYGNPLRVGRLSRLYDPFLGPGALGFALGAHVGKRVRCWHVLGAGVVAAEPQPDLVRMPRRICGRAAGVTILPEAVGRAARAPGGQRASPQTGPGGSGRVGSEPAFHSVRWRARSR